MPATSQLDWLISITAITVLSGSRRVRHRLRSFNFCMGRSIDSHQRRWIQHPRRYPIASLLVGLSPAGMAASLAAPDPYGPNSGIRLVWELLCQGCITPFLSCFVASFFCSTSAASILPSRPHITVAVAHSDGQGRRFFSAAEGLSLTNASTAAGCP